MPVNHKNYDFQGKTSRLAKAKGTCEDFDRIASPYIEAAQWERDTGNNISSVVGINSAVDMDQAAGRLVEIKDNCKKCGNAVCQFAGVERMSPQELLALSEVEGK